tara:strand:- start:5064 stop:5306 length:243 start_codon:yes stop_codon:yes gene_type:complete
MTNRVLFPDRVKVCNPSVIIRHTISKHDFYFESKIKRGTFYLVIPHTAQEVMLLQMLGKNIDVFVPSEGDGLLVKEGCFV